MPRPPQPASGGPRGPCFRGAALGTLPAPCSSLGACLRGRGPCPPGPGLVAARHDYPQPPGPGGLVSRCALPSGWPRARSRACVAGRRNGVESIGLESKGTGQRGDGVQKNRRMQRHGRPWMTKGRRWPPARRILPAGGRQACEGRGWGGEPTTIETGPGWRARRGSARLSPPAATGPTARAASFCPLGCAHMLAFLRTRIPPIPTRARLRPFLLLCSAKRCCLCAASTYCSSFMETKCLMDVS